MGFEKDLVNIEPSFECLKFLVWRTLRDDYRGTHKLQHYRWDLNYVRAVLENLVKFSDKDGFLYHTKGDVGINFRYDKSEANFCKFLKYTNLELANFNFSVTDNAMRKIIFVNLQRMGFVERFNKNKILCDIGKICRNYRFVKVTDSAKALLNATNLFEESKILGVALDKIFDGLVQEIYDILSETKFLDIYEFAFFVSYLGKNYKNQIITKEKVVEFIKEYRGLKVRQKAVICVVKSFCKPENFAGNKTDKRDFHNWINEAQTIFDSLNLMAYFELDFKSKRLYLRGKNEISSLKFKRSSIAKEEYFKNHEIFKDILFELHHIVPFYYATDLEMLKIIDAWQNLIYIDANSHKLLTHNKNAIRLNFKDDNVVLDDFLDFVLELKFNQNIKYKESLKSVMSEYNKRLLNE